jgi:hypothetical protein
MEKIIISKFKNQLIIHFVSVETDPRLRYVNSTIFYKENYQVAKKARNQPNFLAISLVSS